MSDVVRSCVICGAPAPAGLGPDAQAYCDACRGRTTEGLERLVRLAKELDDAREQLAAAMARNLARIGGELPKRRRRAALKESAEDRESRLLREAIERIRDQEDPR